MLTKVASCVSWVWLDLKILTHSVHDIWAGTGGSEVMTNINIGTQGVNTLKKLNLLTPCRIQYWFILTLNALWFRTRLDQDTVIKVFGISFKDYCESLIKNTMVNNASKVRSNFLFIRIILIIYSTTFPCFSSTRIWNRTGQYLPLITLKSWHVFHCELHYSTTEEEH